MLQLISRRPNQHVAHEESVVGTGADDPHPDPVAHIPAREAVDDVDAIPGVEVVDGTFTVDPPDLRSISECSDIRRRKAREAFPRAEKGKVRMQEA